jgi:hypothetical protein
MKIKETYIVWSERFNQLVKLHYTTYRDGSGARYFIEVNLNIVAITIDEAHELLDQYN